MKRSPLKCSPRPKFSTPKHPNMQPKFVSPQVTPVKRERECIVNPFTPTSTGDPIKKLRLAALDSPRVVGSTLFSFNHFFYSISMVEPI